MDIRYRRTDFVANRYKQLVGQIQSVIESRMLDAAAELQADTPEDTGTAKRSWDIDVSRKGKDIIALVTNTAQQDETKYGLYALEGRPPGKFPPYGAKSHLARWAATRGINPYLVARKIAQEGTERFKEGPHHFDQSGEPVEKGAIGRAVTLIKSDIQKIKAKKP